MLSFAHSASILNKFVLHWMGGDVFNDRCFLPPGEQSNGCVDVPIQHELLALVNSQMKALEFRRIRGLVSSRRGCWSGHSPSLIRTLLL